MVLLVQIPTARRLPPLPQELVDYFLWRHFASRPISQVTDRWSSLAQPLGRP